METKPYVYATWILFVVLAILGFGGWMAGLMWPSVGLHTVDLIIGYFAIIIVFMIQDEQFQVGLLTASGVFSMVLWSGYNTWHSPWYLMTPLWLAQALLLVLMVYAWFFPDRFSSHQEDLATVIQKSKEEKEVARGEEPEHDAVQEIAY